MKEVTVQAVPLGGDLQWYACECSACGPITLCVAAMVTAACQEHLREHGAVGIKRK